MPGPTRRAPRSARRATSSVGSAISARAIADPLALAARQAVRIAVLRAPAGARPRSSISRDPLPSLASPATPWIASGPATICPTVMRGLSDVYGSWNTMCICRRSGRSARRDSRLMSRPSRTTLPPSARAGGRRNGRPSSCRCRSRRRGPASRRAPIVSDTSSTARNDVPRRRTARDRRRNSISRPVDVEDRLALDGGHGPAGPGWKQAAACSGRSGARSGSSVPAGRSVARGQRGAKVHDVAGASSVGTMPGISARRDRGAVVGPRTAPSSPSV